MNETREQEQRVERRRLERWIALERAGRDREAEAMLNVLFESLPLLRPTGEFADRVLAKAGLGDSARARAWRYLAAACLALLAVGASVIPFALLRLVQETGSGLLVGLVSDLMVVGSQAAAGVLGMAQAVLGVAETIESVLASPEALTVAVAITLLGVAGFRWLHGLVMTERGAQYVPSA